MTGFFQVKNFEKFQHYKDRSPPWIRFYNAILDDYEYARLQDASKAHLTGIWLLASRYDNKIPYDPEWIARRINATTPVNLEELASAGFIVCDQGCSGTLAGRMHDAKPEERRAEQSREVLSAPAPARETAPEPACRIEFEYQFWPAYPNKVARPAAMRAFIAARQKTSLAEILAGVERYSASKPKDRDWLNPENFLNNERWNDEPAELAAGSRETAHDTILRSLARVAEAGLRPDGGGQDGAPPHAESERHGDDPEPYREPEIPPQLRRIGA